MSTQHTPGRVEHDMRGYPHSDVRAVSGRKIANTWGTGHPKTAEAYKRRTEEDRANARRIVACWNACEGIPTDEMESKGLPLYMHGKLIAQRDKLLEALQLCEGNIASLAAAHPNIYSEWLAVVRAAIEKATGAA